MWGAGAVGWEGGGGGGPAGKGRDRIAPRNRPMETAPRGPLSTRLSVRPTLDGGEAGGPRSIPQNGIPKSYQDGLYNCSLDKTGISKYVKDNYVINGTFFQKYWRKSGNRHYSAPIKNIPKSLIKLLK